MTPAQAGAAEARELALWYEPPEGAPGGVRVPADTRHRTVPVGRLLRSHLVGALLELRPQPGARLAVLGEDASMLSPAARRALRARVSFLPAAGGMISSLNGWENIVLPLGYRDAKRVGAAAPKVHALIERLGGNPRRLLAKLPEEMTSYEKKLAGYVRILLEAPALVVAENLSGGLEPEERRRIADFPATYHDERPDGVFVQLEDAPDQ